VQLTDSTVSGAEGNGSPDWSPDGSRIAFSSRHGGDWDVFLLEDGVETNLTSTPGEDDKADWSPDGSRIALNSRRSGRQWADVFVIDMDGSRTRDLSANDDDDREPVWSPNGQEIVYRSFRDGNYDLYVMDVESSAPRYLTKTEPPAWNASPAWSPDGAQIAFETNRDGNWEIYITDNNGSSLRNLTRSTADEIEPAWSPDGTRIIFTSNRDGNYELYLMDLTSSSVTRLTYDCGRDHNADWRRTDGDVTGGDPVRTVVAYVVSSLNLRTGPGLNFAQVGGAEADDCLTVFARSEDDQWLQVRTEEGVSAWAARSLVDVDGDLDSVPFSS
jgi:Tol biopolymer transport system component